VRAHLDQGVRRARGAATVVEARDGQQYSGRKDRVPRPPLFLFFWKRVRGSRRSATGEMCSAGMIADATRGGY